MNSQDETRFGQARFKAGEDGELVRLGVLIRRVMTEHKTVRTEAVERYLLKALRSESPPDLFRMRQGGMAVLSDHNWFRTSTGARGPKAGQRVMLSRGIQYAAKSPPQAKWLGSGIVGAANWIMESWANPASCDSIMDSLGAAATMLAIKRADADSICGEVKITECIDSPIQKHAQPAFLNRAKGSRWDANSRAELLQCKREFVKQGASSARVYELLHELCGLSRAALEPQLKQAEEEKKSAIAFNQLLFSNR